MNYQIVLFKNKTKKKIINKFKTHKRANNFFESLINESESVIFDKNLLANLKNKGSHSLLANF